MWGHLRYFFLLNEPFIWWPQGTWRSLGMAFLSITAFLFECIIHSLGCSEEPEDMPQPGPGGSLAPWVPSLCPPCALPVPSCIPFQGAPGPGHRLPVWHTRAHRLSSALGHVHTCVLPYCLHTRTAPAG